MSTESSLRKTLENKYKAIKHQGEFIRKLKSSHAPESEYQEALKVLRGLKLERNELLVELEAVGFNGMSRETFREAVDKSLRKNMFSIRSRKIYDYDYAMPACFIKQNVLDFWRQAMTKEQALEMKAALESIGEIGFFEVCELQKFVTIKKNMVSFAEEKKLEHVRTFTPHVIEAGFEIGRILYCLYEHSYYTRLSKTGIRQLTVFRFPPLVAPFKCAVFPLVNNKQYKDVAERIIGSLKAVGIHQMLIKGTSIEKKYANADELGVPFAVTVDSETSVTIRERDSGDLIRVNVDEVVAVVKKLSKGKTTWADISQKDTAHTSGILQETCLADCVEDPIWLKTLLL